MNEEFIKGKELDFVDSKETGPFWGGMDESHGCRYELFFGGDAKGPREGLIECYQKMLTRFDWILTEIRDRIKETLMAEGIKIWNKFQDSPLEVDIISVDRERS